MAEIDLEEEYEMKTGTGDFTIQVDGVTKVCPTGEA
jgi:hypothetical protein